MRLNPILYSEVIISIFSVTISLLTRGGLIKKDDTR